MGKSIKSECVIQILSHPQKHEQVLKFPTHILSAQSGSVTAHKWFDAAWGPAAVWGGGLSFHRSTGPGVLTEPFLSLWAGRGLWSPPNGPLAPGIHTFHALCATVLSQHSSRQSAWWSCKPLPASYLIPKLWFLAAGLPPHKDSKAKESSWSFKGLSCPHCSVFHMDSSICDGFAAVWPRHTRILWIWNMRWKGHCSGSLEQTSYFGSKRKQKTLVSFLSSDLLKIHLHAAFFHQDYFTLPLGKVCHCFSFNPSCSTSLSQWITSCLKNVWQCILFFT